MVSSVKTSLGDQSMKDSDQAWVGGTLDWGGQGILQEA
jgi:hypothetical protein